MKEIVFILLVLSVIFVGLPKLAVSDGNVDSPRYNKCYRNPDDGLNPGFICETDNGICYLMRIPQSLTLLYCKKK